MGTRGREEEREGKERREREGERGREREGRVEARMGEVDSKYGSKGLKRSRILNSMLHLNWEDLIMSCN